MAFSTTCPKGHHYVQSDIYHNWPDGAPYCPICFEDWKISKIPNLQNEISRVGEMRHFVFVKYDPLRENLKWTVVVDDNRIGDTDDPTTLLKELYK